MANHVTNEEEIKANDDATFEDKADYGDEDNGESDGYFITDPRTGRKYFKPASHTSICNESDAEESMPQRNEQSHQSQSQSYINPKKRKEYEGRYGATDTLSERDKDIILTGLNQIR